MKEKIKVIISFALILVCLPYLVTYFFQGEETRAIAGDAESGKIAGILAAQVPVTVEEEALKAQAVIARTQLLWAKENKGKALEPLSKQEMEKLWGQEKYYEFYEKMIRAVQDTDGQVMMFDGAVINPSFHKVSAGATRDGSQIYKDTPYLLSVNSREDILSEDYLNVQFFTKEEFEAKIAAIGETDGKNQTLKEYVDSIKTETDAVGYVTKLTIGKTETDVDMFVKALGLPSACFSIKEMDDHIRIVTKGCGHGFGLSQYGANEMAKDEKNYEEILKYYFSGIKIEKTGED